MQFLSERSKDFASTFKGSRKEKTFPFIHSFHFFNGNEINIACGSRDSQLDQDSACLLPVGQNV